MALATWRWRWVPSLTDTPRHGAGDRGGGAFEPAASVRAGAAVATAPAAAAAAAVGSFVGRGRGGGGRQRAAGGAAVRQREAAADARVGHPTVPAHRQPDRGRVAARRLPL